MFKRKVELICEDFGYWTIEDYTDYFEDIKAEEGIEKALDYFRCGEFDDEFVNKNNGKHFLFGYMESLGQSDNCPPQLFYYSGKTIYKVSEV